MILLPPLAYSALLLLLVSLRPYWGWRRCALRSAVLWASYAIALTELLSLVRWVRGPALAAGWALAASAMIAWLIARRVRGRPVVLPMPGAITFKPQAALAAGIGLILAATAIVAWFAPPQTWDSLNYHMARVAHWAQQGSLSHYASGIEIQNSRPTGAESLVLQLYVLADGDRLVNFVQWSAMVLSLVGVSLIAAEIGAGSRGQWAAAVFAATLPMGIVQASSTTTDYLVALWEVTAAFEVLLIRRDGPNWSSLTIIGLAAGLGLATKPTAAAYLAPVGACLTYLLLKGGRTPRVLLMVALPFMLALGLNIGELARNAATYGSPLDPGQVEVHANQLRDLRGVTSNLLRSAALQLGTPSPHVNKAIALAVQWVHERIGLDVNDPRTTAHGVFKVTTPSVNEDRAGNPLHSYLLLALAVYGMFRRGRIPRFAAGYTLLPLLGFVGLNVLFKWQIFAGRYHLGTFVLLAPFAGVALERIDGKWLTLASAALILASWPWLFRIQSRPIVPDDTSYVGSILRVPRRELYLANARNLIDPYTAFTERVMGSGCGQVGIMLLGNAAEYPLWAYLGAPRSGIDLQWLVAGTPSARYSDPNFRPCAVICEGCAADQAEVRGLLLDAERSGFRLYLAAAGR